MKFCSAYSPLKQQILFCGNGLPGTVVQILRIYSSQKHIKVNNDHKSAIYNFIEVYSSQKWPQVGHFEFDQVEISTVYPHWKPHILLILFSNGLAIWHGFTVTTHIEVKSSRRSAILNMIKFHFFMVYPYLKLHVLFNSMV